MRLDTDSIFTTTQLPEHNLGSALGQMKLEYVANKAIFIAPKVYGLILTDGTEIVKIKGSKPNHEVDVAYLESLLQKDNTIEINQEKWYRDIIESTINIRSTLYTLKVTEGKRQLVYYGGIFTHTNPYIINNNLIISSNSLFLENFIGTPLLIEAPKTLMIESPKLNFELIIDLGDGTNNYPRIIAPNQVPLIESPTSKIITIDDSILGIPDTVHYNEPPCINTSLKSHTINQSEESPITYNKPIKSKNKINPLILHPTVTELIALSNTMLKEMDDIDDTAYEAGEPYPNHDEKVNKLL